MEELDGPRWGPKSGGAAKELIVLCHGVGADGHDLIELALSWSHVLPEAAFVAPHAPFAYDLAPIGRQWFSLAEISEESWRNGVRRTAPVLSRFLDAESARLGIQAASLALMGFSQGAMMALFVGLRHASVRAILAFSGMLVDAASLAAEIRSRPLVLLVHGEADPVVPASASRAAERALGALDVSVEALYRPHLGHGIDDVGLSTGALFLQRAFSNE